MQIPSDITTEVQVGDLFDSIGCKVAGIQLQHNNVKNVITAVVEFDDKDSLVKALNVTTRGIKVSVDRGSRSSQNTPKGSGGFGNQRPSPREGMGGKRDGPQDARALSGSNKYQTEIKQQPPSFSQNQQPLPSPTGNTATVHYVLFS